MDSFSRWFCILVVVADLLAITYFGGMFFITGSLLPKHEEAHIVVAGAEDPNAHKSTVSAPKPDPDVLPEGFVADAARGATISAKCKACHSFDADGKHRIGPKMWDIFGKQIASYDEFSYSSAFYDKQGEIVWDEEALYQYLKNPKAYIPGTKMAFPGLKKAADRANLIAYLKTLQ